MTTTIVLAILVVLPVALALISIPVRIKQLSFMDMNNPRQQGTQLEGPGQRLMHAQANAWEAVIIYLAALFIADQHQLAPEAISIYALVYLAARVLHVIFYVANLGYLRFASFLVGFLAMAGIAVRAFSA